MFADPQSVTVNSVAQSLARTGSGIDTGIFSKDDGSYKLSISHAYGKRARRTIRLDAKKTSADVMDSSLNVPYSMAVYAVVDVPFVGYTIAEQKLVTDGFFAYLTASSGAKITQLLGGEA
jgi:hypothetical protein